MLAYAEQAVALLDPHVRLEPGAGSRVPVQVVLRRRSILDACSEALRKQWAHWKLPRGRLWAREW